MNDQAFADKLINIQNLKLGELFELAERINIPYRGRDQEKFTGQIMTARDAIILSYVDLLNGETTEYIKNIVDLGNARGIIIDKSKNEQDIIRLNHLWETHLLFSFFPDNPNMVRAVIYNRFLYEAAGDFYLTQLQAPKEPNFDDYESLITPVLVNIAVTRGIIPEYDPSPYDRTGLITRLRDLDNGSPQISSIQFIDEEIIIPSEQEIRDSKISDIREWLTFFGLGRRGLRLKADYVKRALDVRTFLLELGANGSISEEEWVANIPNKFI